MNKKLILAAGVGAAILLAKTVSAQPVAHITAIAHSRDKTTCQGACTVNGTITWRNDGTVSGVFVPSISVNGNQRAIASEKVLDPGEEISIPFTEAITETTDICPVPN